MSIPGARGRDPRVMRLRVTYTAGMLALTALVTAVGALDMENPVVYCAIALLLPALGFMGMLVCRAKVRALKVREGWVSKGSRASVALLPADAPGAIPFSWNLLYVPVILATAVLTVALYPSMPDQLPMQAGFDGVVHSWAQKSVGTAALPVIVQVFVAAMMVFCHWSILHSKKGSAGSRPVASGLAYGRFAQLESAMLLGFGLALVASIAAMTLSNAALIDLDAAGAIVLVVTLVSTVAAVGVSVWCGQSGARLLGAADESETLASDEDSSWKAGVFYVDREDPSLFVPKRFGIGWTLNFGNWRSWVVMVGFVAVTVGFIVLVAAISG